jgi:outer membrane protein assembly factor BamD
MKSVKSLIPFIAIAVFLTACGGGKAKSKVAIEEAKAGRDQELFRSAAQEVHNGHYDSARVLYNTILNTYPDSPLAPVIKLAVPDTFYLEGGSKNLAQAEAGYREWLQYFPDSPLADEVRLKIAEIHMRQVMAPDRDITHARQAEKELQEIMRLNPNSPKKPEVEARVDEIQEYLAKHELKVARFYYDHREAAAATQSRTEEILNKYPHFSQFDEALYYHAKSMADQEDTETASQDLTRLVKLYPKSQYRGKAELLLKKWNKPLPEPDQEKLAEAGPETKGMVPRFLGFVMGPHVSNLSSKGVVLDRTLKADEIVAQAVQISGPSKAGGPVTPGAATSSNSPDSRARRATQAGQDVEVKPASSDQGEQKTTDKDKKKKPGSTP